MLERFCMQNEKGNVIRFAVEKDFCCNAVLEAHGKALSFFSNGEKNWYQLNHNVADVWKRSVEKKFVDYTVGNTKDKFIEGTLSFFNGQNLV